jgi:long-chain acyl-CoA synthetase
MGGWSILPKTERKGMFPVPFESERMAFRTYRISAANRRTLRRKMLASIRCARRRAVETALVLSPFPRIDWRDRHGELGANASEFARSSLSVRSGFRQTETPMRLGTVVSCHARYRPDRLAVIHEDFRLTYGQFNKRVNRLANALVGAGIRKNDKVACILPNSLELLELYWAVAKTGAVVVPLSPLLTDNALVKLIRHSDSVMVLVSADLASDHEGLGSDLSGLGQDRYVIVGGASNGGTTYHDFVGAHPCTEPPEVAIDDDDPLMIIYSSGTTGDPKGIVLTHYARAMYCTLYASAWRMTPESISLHTGSLVFNGAFMTLLPSFFLGGTYVLHRQFDPEATLATIERERITHLVLVPSQILALLESRGLSPARIESLQALISLGSTLHLRHKVRLKSLLHDRFYEMYGLAEGFMTILDKSDPPDKLGSVGTPPPFFEMRIVDDNGRVAAAQTVGEIVGRGPILMKGYYGRPDLTEKAIVGGWLHSGDLGYLDADGYLFLVDRKKDMIKSGGVSVYPRDIEEVIVRHPAVAEAAVFGIPDEKWGETPVAAVTLGAAQTITSNELRAWINANVSAKFQRVSDVQIVETFPRNTAGKTLKRALQEQYLHGRHASAARDA